MLLTATQVTVASAKRRWYEATAGTTLFYLTKDPVDPITGFEVAYTINQPWFTHAVYFSVMRCVRHVCVLAVCIRRVVAIV
jgi:hypothetical protein